MSDGAAASKAKTAEYVPPKTLNSFPSDKQHDVCLEQYKVYVTDLGNIGTRYATVQGFYISVIAALISLLALAESAKVLGKIQTPTLIVFCLFSIAMCVVWSITISYYRRLFRAKFTVIKVLESNLAYPCYDVEYNLLSPRPFLTRIESAIPIILSLFFVALLIFEWVKG